MANTHESPATHLAQTTRITAREKTEFLALFRKVLDAIPADRSCMTCTHYRDGLCDQSEGAVIPAEVREIGCALRADSVGTVFG